MTSLTFTKETFINNINQYVYKHNLYIISFIEDNIKCFKLIKHLDSIKAFEQSRVEFQLTCELLTFDSFYYFLLNNLNIFDFYKPEQSLFKLLLHLTSFNTIINFYNSPGREGEVENLSLDEDDNNSLFIIDII